MTTVIQVIPQTIGTQEAAKKRELARHANSTYRGRCDFSRIQRRKTLLSTLLALFGSLASRVHAQSSVTLYGIVDESIQYVHNTAGQHTQVGLQSGQMSISQWGMKGNENLGDGLNALFDLQNGFDVNSGKLSGSKLFGRRAYVGLSSNTWGTLTLGRQQNVLSDLVLPVQGNNFLEYFTTPGDVDLADGSVRASNSIKWESPIWAGVQIGILYSFGGVPGSVKSGSSYSSAVSYSQGEWTLAAGYSHEDNGNSNLSTRGTTSTDSIFFSSVNAAYASASGFNITRVACNYVVGPFTIGGYYSYSEYLADGASTFKATERYNNGSVYVYWQVSAAVAIEAGYDYMKSHGDSSATYHQATLAANYSLTRRTDLYSSISYGHASGRNGGGSAKAVIADSSPAAGNSNQVLSMLGIRHRF
ncbi:porin [Paraburkholderia humisilvae]|nr:porin [Paraburkholderia humisilvae]